jgi:hypothetical protein
LEHPAKACPIEFITEAQENTEQRLCALCASVVKFKT